jgi:hypothetical protein
VQLVEELIRSDRKITTDSVATALGCPHGLPYSIMHDRLKSQKVCAPWVPRELMDREKMNRMGLSLRWYANKGEYILKGILTGDEKHNRLL